MHSSSTCIEWCALRETISLGDKKKNSKAKRLDKKYKSATYLKIAFSGGEGFLNYLTLNFALHPIQLGLEHTESLAYVWQSKYFRYPKMNDISEIV